MRFACDSCRAQYMISDEKVGARGVKVRCKKCGHVIHVRRPDAEADAAAAGAVAALQETESPAAVPDAPTEDNNIFSGVDEDEIGAAFDQALGGEAAAVTNPFQPPADTDSTQVMDEQSVKRFAEMSLGGGTPTPVPPPPPAAGYEWFVAVNEVQTGPLSESRVKELWDRGEIGPDSLTWRQGLSDWIPLSDVGELATLLAPRPVRPVFAGPAVTPMPSSVMTVPVESAFSAGGMTRTVRSEVPVATATPDTGFRPTATAALASLVKDEIAALNKPPPPREAPAPAPRSILEVPEEPVKRPGPSSTAMPAVRPGANGAPTVPTPFAYRTSTSSAAAAARKGITAWLAGLGIIVAALVVVVGFLIFQTLHKPAPQVVAVLPPPPVPAPAAPPAPVPSTPGPAVASAVQPTTPPAPSKPTPPGSLAKAPTPVPAVEPPTSRHGTRHTSKGQSNGSDNTLEGPAKDTIEASRPRNKADDLFDEVFGTPDGKKAAPEGKKTAYVPPAPGVTDVPEKVGDGDIMSVVLANKSAMVRCVDEQKSRDPNLHGTLVMHWVIQTSGKTTNVAPVTEGYKTSYFATCMTGLVKTWQFPKHRYSPGQAVDFPFKF
ncbi:MAG: adventurous gliding motility protein GltJ [Myxococcaceae bacterium]